MLFKDLKEIVKTIEEKYNNYDIDNFKIILNEDEDQSENYDVDCVVNVFENYIKFISTF